MLYPNLGYDPVKSFAPVATLAHGRSDGGRAGRAGQDRRELIAYAKANPGKLKFGYGLATMPHILGETFKQADRHRPHRRALQGRRAGARADLLGGRIHINFAPPPQLLPLIQDGKMRALAFTGPKRSPDLPDVPTMNESGLPQVGFHPDVWMGSSRRTARRPHRRQAQRATSTKC